MYSFSKHITSEYGYQGDVLHVHVHIMYERGPPRAMDGPLSTVPYISWSSYYQWVLFQLPWSTPCTMRTTKSHGRSPGCSYKWPTSGQVPQPQSMREHCKLSHGGQGQSTQHTHTHHTHLQCHMDFLVSSTSMATDVGF